MHYSIPVFLVLLINFFIGCTNHSDSKNITDTNAAIDTPSISNVSNESKNNDAPNVPNYIGVFVNARSCIRINPDYTFVRYFAESDFSNVDLALDDPNKPIPNIWKPGYDGKWRISNDIIEFYDVVRIEDDGTRRTEPLHTEGELPEYANNHTIWMFEESKNKLRLDGNSFCFNSFQKGGTVCFEKASNNWSEFLGPNDKEQ